MTADTKKRIEQLRAEIRGHDYLYYVLNQPEITDQQYDKLFAELKALEGQHPNLITPDSPTQRVSERPIEGFAQVRHAVPMLSMDNTYNAEELRAFDERVAKGLESKDYDYVVELKIDGLAVSLRYEKGILALGTTRGDGSKGDDVTHNIRTIKAIPLRLTGDAPQTIEVRGEVYMPTKSFVGLNKQREKEGEQLFANPRNAAAGSLKLLDSKITAQRNLSFFAYAVGEVSKPLAKDHYEMLLVFKKLGLPVNPNIKKAKNIDEVIEICNSWDDKREKLDYQIDGMVVKVNNLEQREILGFTGRSPRWCISYKFAAEQAETKVESIDVQVGKTGTLTPVVNLEPVQLAGTTVKRASLHNFDEVERLDVRVGDTVIIEKAGEIIPQVIQVSQKSMLRGGKIATPKICPVCKQKVKVIKRKRIDKESLSKGKSEFTHTFVCVNPNCPAKLKEKLEYFVGRNQMDIENLGEAIIDQLVEKGLVRNFADIYKLDVFKLSQLERMGTKSAENVLVSIEKSKTQPLWRFLAALGIPNVGGETSRILADKFGSLDKLKNATLEYLRKALTVAEDHIIPKTIYDFLKNPENKDVIQEVIRKNITESLSEKIKKLSIKHVGPKRAELLAKEFDSIEKFCETSFEEFKNILSKKPDPVIPQSIYDYFHDKQNLYVIQLLLDAGVNPSAPQQKSSDILAGKTIVVTGSFENFTRSQIEQFIKDNGGKVSSSVSKKTSFVVEGKDAGSKLDKANQLEVEVMDENQFLQLIQKKPKSKKKSGFLWE
ncbi:MAG: NAD-dependent DNA ligase LigA [Sedimentisphaerales bacterium]